MSAIPPISAASTAIPSSLVSGAAPQEHAASFQDLLMNSVGEVNTMQQRADHVVEQFFTGGEVNPAEVLIAVQKADMAFRLLMQVRNKLVEAYEEVKNIRV